MDSKGARMALSSGTTLRVMAQLPDRFILSEDGYYIEYIGGMEQPSPTRTATRNPADNCWTCCPRTRRRSG